jgi:hypothetical protein
MLTAKNKTCTLAHREPRVWRKFPNIHFRTDNEVAVDLGKKVAAKIIQRIQADAANEEMKLAKQK